jgi:hypothetical protein
VLVPWQPWQPWQPNVWHYEYNCTAATPGHSPAVQLDWIGLDRLEHVHQQLETLHRVQHKTVKNITNSKMKHRYADSLAGSESWAIATLQAVGSILFPFIYPRGRLVRTAFSRTMFK